MLLDGHDLYGIIAALDHAWQHVEPEFLVGAHSLFVLCHAYVAFIDEQRRHIGHEVVHFHLIRLGRSPHLCRENLRLLVLHHACGIGWDALAAAAIPVHHELEQVAVGHGVLGQLELPVAVAHRLHVIRCTLAPAVELAYDKDVGGIRRPFAQHPALGGVVQPVVVIGIGKVAQPTTAAREFIDLAQCIIVAANYGLLIGLKPRIIFYYSKLLLLSFCCHFLLQYYTDNISQK